MSLDSRMVIAVGLIVAFALSGCAYTQSTRTSSSGLGTIHAPNQALTYTLTIHYEERPEEGTVDKLVSIVTSVPQAVVAAVTQPVNEGFGGDRKEVVIEVSIADAENIDVVAVMRQVVRSVERAQVDASVTHTDEMGPRNSGGS